MLTSKEISSISLPALDNAAHYMFISSMKDLFMSNEAICTKCKKYVDALCVCTETENTNLKVSTRSNFTTQISEADSERDALYASYKKMITGFMNFPIAEMAEAARILNQHIKDYKINVHMQMDKESALLINFLSDLESKFLKQINTLSLNVLVQKLKSANENVCKLSAMRKDEQTAKTVGALRTARLNSDDCYSDLVKFINALAIVEGDTLYASTIDRANTEISHYKQKVMISKKKPTQDTQSISKS